MATTLKNKVGTIRTKLAALLSDKLLNVEVRPEDLNSNVPRLADKYHDCCSWDGWGTDKITGFKVHICSWNTMTECVDNGFFVEEYQGEYQITIDRGLT